MPPFSSELGTFRTTCERRKRSIPSPEAPDEISPHEGKKLGYALFVNKADLDFNLDLCIGNSFNP